MNELIELVVEYPSYYLQFEGQLDCDLLVDCPETILELDTEIIVKKGEGDPYEGEYVVDPTSTTQILLTESKNLHDNITINPIPYYETSNPSGGYTVIIG